MEDATLAETALAILRAELGQVLHGVKNATYQAERTGTEPEFPVRRVAVVRAFERARLLSAGDAGRWRESFEEASLPLGPPVVDAALRRSIDDYLGGLVAAAVDPSDQSDAWLRSQGAWNVLRAAGVIDDDEVSRWMHRLRGEPPEASGTTPSPHVAQEQFQPDRPIRSVAGPSLRRRGLRVIAVDLFERGAVVRLDLARRGRNPDGGFRPLADEIEPDAPLAARNVFQVSVADDIGTEYKSHGAHGDRVAPVIDAPLWQRWTVPVTPAVPPDARRLLVGWGDISFEVPL